MSFVKVVLKLVRTLDIKFSAVFSRYIENHGELVWSFNSQKIMVSQLYCFDHLQKQKERSNGDQMRGSTKNLPKKRRKIE